MNLELNSDQFRNLHAKCWIADDNRSMQNAKSISLHHNSKIAKQKTIERIQCLSAFRCFKVIFNSTTCFVDWWFPASLVVCLEVTKKFRPKWSRFDLSCVTLWVYGWESLIRVHLRLALRCRFAIEIWQDLSLLLPHLMAEIITKALIKQTFRNLLNLIALGQNKRSHMHDSYGRSHKRKLRWWKYFLMCWHLSISWWWINNNYTRSFNFQF